MKKSILTISCICIVAVGTFLFTQAHFKSDTSKAQAVNATNNTPLKVTYVDQSDLQKSLEAIKNGHKKVEATYNDGSASISEMKKNADQIVIGKVISQKQFSSVSVVSTVAVSKTSKGRHFDTIDVYQLGNLGGSDILNTDNEYILFLGYQGASHENKFYIKGGIQGSFLNANGKLSNSDSMIVQDLAKIKADKNKDSEFEALSEFISE